MDTTTTPRAWVGTPEIGDWFDHDSIPATAREWVETMADNGLVPINPNLPAAEYDQAIEQAVSDYAPHLHIYRHEGLDGLLPADRASTLEEGRIAAVEWDRLHEDMDEIDDDTAPMVEIRFS